MVKHYLLKMGYAFVALCLFSSTVVLTTACGDDDELEYREELPEEKEEPKDEVGEAIDLGLPSGILWASHNVGATKPEEYGDYFAWGETSPKTNYDWSTYKYGSDWNELTKYCTDDYYGIVDNKTILEPSDDAATVNWGSGWRMPTWDELNELRNNCTWTWTTLNGVKGQLVTGSNGNSIFLPAAGGRDGTSLDDAGSYGYYWSSSLYSDYPYIADDLGCDFGGHDWDYDDRYYGLSVRPVRASAQN